MRGRQASTGGNRWRLTQANSCARSAFTYIMAMSFKFVSRLEIELLLFVDLRALACVSTYTSGLGIVHMMSTRYHRMEEYGIARRILRGLT